MSGNEQKTNCGMCGEHRNTPWRDGEFGYVCLPCLGKALRENAELRTALEHYIDMTTLAIPDDWNPAKMGGWPDINQLEKRDVGDVAREALRINDVVNERL